MTVIAPAAKPTCFRGHYWIFPSGGKLMHPDDVAGPLQPEALKEIAAYTSKACHAYIRRGAEHLNRH